MPAPPTSWFAASPLQDLGALIEKDGEKRAKSKACTYEDSKILKACYQTVKGGSNYEYRVKLSFDCKGKTVSWIVTGSDYVPY